LKFDYYDNLEFWVNRGPRSEIADFETIFVRSVSALTPTEKKFSYH